MMRFTVEEKSEFTIVTFTLSAPIEPQVLKEINPPTVNLKKGVILSGRGPIWLFAYLTHYYHPAAWVSTYDPRLGAVVVQSHTPSIKEGDIVDIS